MKKFCGKSHMVQSPTCRDSWDIEFMGTRSCFLTLVSSHMSPSHPLLQSSFPLITLSPLPHSAPPPFYQQLLFSSISFTSTNLFCSRRSIQALFMNVLDTPHWLDDLSSASFSPILLSSTFQRQPNCYPLLHLHVCVDAPRLYIVFTSVFLLSSLQFQSTSPHLKALEATNFHTVISNFAHVWPLDPHETSDPLFLLAWAALT